MENTLSHSLLYQFAKVFLGSSPIVWQVIIWKDWIGFRVRMKCGLGRRRWFLSCISMERGSFLMNRAHNKTPAHIPLERSQKGPGTQNKPPANTLYQTPICCDSLKRGLERASFSNVLSTFHFLNGSANVLISPQPSHHSSLAECVWLLNSKTHMTHNLTCLKVTRSHAVLWDMCAGLWSVCWAGMQSGKVVKRFPRAF